MGGLILAAALAAHIQTGGDLLTACTAKDTSACDRYIHQQMASDVSYGCVDLRQTKRLREVTIRGLERNASVRTKPAKKALDAAFSDDSCTL
jgi:hypothetical protein